ncbi:MULTISPECIES: histidine kinase [Haloferax]|uniref:Histidine kinase n=1 Tax=Haloferax marinum TaxID=2666143 RepID=A0A6A8GB08_9EURY|nr:MULTISPECIES: histidine kinase [Haloferax]KAB1198166.1 histidine kinase [Haloferax sp. CBA1150]MRW97246.1 histidine kinase [Haloferax marinum]
MSETTGEVTPQILAYGPPPDGTASLDSDVDVRYFSSNHEVVEAMAPQVPQLFICLHAPPRYDGIATVKAVRRFDASVPVVLATNLQSTMVNLQAIQTKVTWSVELPTGKPAKDGLFDVVRDASEWLETQQQ